MLIRRRVASICSAVCLAALEYSKKPARQIVPAQQHAVLRGIRRYECVRAYRDATTGLSCMGVLLDDTGRAPELWPPEGDGGGPYQVGRDEETSYAIGITARPTLARLGIFHRPMIGTDPRVRSSGT